MCQGAAGQPGHSMARWEHPLPDCVGSTKLHGDTASLARKPLQLILLPYFFFFFETIIVALQISKLIQLNRSVKKYAPDLGKHN